MAERFDFKGETNSLAFRNLSVDFKKGKFYAIIGEVGSGKTSLLYTCLQELVITSGDVKINGKVSYVPQQAFLLNETLRDNILFYKGFDLDWYAECVIKCGLYDDL